MEQISKKLMNWASILERQHPRAGGDDLDDAVHLPAPRADARRPPRQGRDRRVGHPDPRRDHPRRRRRRHRLRHDRRPHPVHRRPTCRPTVAPLREADRAGDPALGRRSTTARSAATTPRTPAARSSRRWPSEAGFDPASYAGQLAAAAGHARLGQPLHRGHASTSTTGSGCSCTPVRAASATRSPSSTSRSRASSARSGGSRCPTATWPTWSRAPTSSTPTSRELRWAQHFALLNREEMMDRVVRQFAEWVGAERRAAARRSTATTTTPSRRRHFGKRRVGVAQGRDQRRGRPARADPRVDGHRVVRRDGQGQPASR